MQFASQPAACGIDGFSRLWRRLGYTSRSTIWVLENKIMYNFQDDVISA